MLFLSASSVSITELNGDVLSLGSYRYLLLPMSLGGSDAGGIMQSLVLYIWWAALENFLTTIACVEMGSVYAQTSVVVHGKPQLLACMKPVTCLRHLGRQSSFGAAVA